VLKILFLTSTLEFCGRAKQLTLLASRLPQARFECRVACLGEEGPAAVPLRAAGVDLCALGWRRLIDPNPLLRLRALVDQLRPDVIHVWGLGSLKAAALLLPRRGARLIFSGEIHQPKGALQGRFLRFLLDRVDLVVPAAIVGAAKYRQIGLPSERIVMIPPGVNPAPAGAQVGRDIRQSLGLPAEARLLIGVGPLEPRKGFRDAIWGFDILQFLHEHLHLLLVGEGSARAALERFACTVGTLENVHFAGAQADVPALLAQAEAVWIPSQTDAGWNVALEAMAAARPVVASNLPGLAEIVIDGATGYLVAPGDKVGLARKTRLLLDEPERARQMGESGRQRVLAHYSVNDMVNRFAELYES